MKADHLSDSHRCQITEHFIEYARRGDMKIWEGV